MTHVYTIPARKKSDPEGERGGAAGGRAATPFAAERDALPSQKLVKSLSILLNSFLSRAYESKCVASKNSRERGGLPSGPVSRLEGKNALRHAAGPTHCGFGTSDLAFGSH